MNSRIVRTGLWESEREKSGNFTPEIYNRYENLAASGVGLIITELFSLYPRDVFSKYTHTLYQIGQVTGFTCKMSVVECMSIF